VIIIDKMLEQREPERRPIRVGLIGAGYMGRGYAFQIVTAVKGMKLVAIANRSVVEAGRAYAEAGIEAVETVATVNQLEAAIATGRYAVTADAMALCEARGIDALIEATGEVEFGAQVTLRAIVAGKDVILSNAELDATLGPILKVYADKAGVVITNTDGDEPGVAMNLFRFVQSIGFRPVLAGNLKGFIDQHRTPATQEGFAARVLQRPRMITSFADGTKLSMEATILANATGLRVGKRGMYGPRCTHVKDGLTLFPIDELLNGGLVDYLLGAEPGTGAFVAGYGPHPMQQRYMSYFKMGDGPLYMFYTPYHLPHLQLPHTVARAVLCRDATVAPLGAPVCDVVTTAKRDLSAGQQLDGIGGFTCYGMIENAELAQAANLLPMGLSAGCRLTADIPADRAITYADVELPKDRVSDRLRAEQTEYFNTVPGSVRARHSSSV
jgi:predicted homoserine dehydrogenase-like protein